MSPGALVKGWMKKWSRGHPQDGSGAGAGTSASPWDSARFGAHALLHPGEIMEEPLATFSVPLGITEIQPDRGLSTAVLFGISMFPKFWALTILTNCT